MNLNLNKTFYWIINLIAFSLTASYAGGGSGHESTVGYVTDLEGNWARFEDYIHRSQVLYFGRDNRVHLKDGMYFVFGGDSVDRGPDGMRVLDSLIDLKHRYSDRVTLILGNRDINKLRLRDQFSPFSPEKNLSETTRSIQALLTSMNAREAFQFRKMELQKNAIDTTKVSDDDVTRSFIQDVLPGGRIYEYIRLGEIVKIIDGNLFTHGQIREESVGFVPGRGSVISDIRQWEKELNEWAHEEFLNWSEHQTTPDGKPGGHGLIAYQQPLPETPGRNDISVVYGRNFDVDGNPLFPPVSLITRLNQQGIYRAVSGHTSQGDAPAILRKVNFEMVFGDNSYSDNNYGSKILIQGKKLNIEAILSGGEHVHAATEIGMDSTIGKTTSDGYLVIGQTHLEDYVLYKQLSGWAIDYHTESNPLF